MILFSTILFLLALVVAMGIMNRKDVVRPEFKRTKSKNNSLRAKATRAFGQFVKDINHMAFTESEPLLKTAVVMRGMRFVRGRLGDTGFRQQYVSDGNGSYTQQTVGFMMPVGNNSNTTLQSNQRSRFRLLAILGGALNRAGVLRAWYYSQLGISSYNAFVRDNLLDDAVIQHSNGTQYIDWTKIRVALGSGVQKILPFKTTLESGTDYDPECQSAVQLRWGSQCDSKTAEQKANYALVLVGVKINDQGTLENVCYVQPGATMANCSIELKLPVCDCCKTYWFAFFANPYNGDNTDSVYIGPDTHFANYPEHDPETCCFTCVEVEDEIEDTTPPDEIPTFCGCGHDHGDVDRTGIVFNGERNRTGIGYSFNDIQMLDAGVNDGSGYEAPEEEEQEEEEEEEPANVVYTIGDGTCPIDWTTLELDLTSYGLSSNETFADGDALAVAFTAALGNGTFVYDAASCTLVSTDSTDTGGNIPLANPCIYVATLITPFTENPIQFIESINIGSDLIDFNDIELIDGGMDTTALTSANTILTDALSSSGYIGSIELVNDGNSGKYFINIILRNLAVCPSISVNMNYGEVTAVPST